jgi:formamidopyrimidine-DNA glycosylase
MPELPDMTVYKEALEQRIVGQRLERISIPSPFLLRTALPPIQTAQGKRVTEVRRIGKRIAIGLGAQLWLVFHLMIAGRLHWFARGTAVSKRVALARLEFANGILTLTEAGTKRRARCTSSKVTTPCMGRTPAVSRSCNPASHNSVIGCAAKTTR